MPKVHRTRDLSRLTVDDLRRHLGDRDDCRLAHNTRLAKNTDGDVHVILHSTRILTFRQWGFTINTGGYRTVTTKQRLNALLPAGYRIYSKSYTWFLSLPNGDDVAFEDGDTYRYDGADCAVETADWDDDPEPDGCQHDDPQRVVGGCCGACGGWVVSSLHAEVVDAETWGGPA